MTSTRTAIVAMTVKHTRTLVDAVIRLQARVGGFFRPLRWIIPTVLVVYLGDQLMRLDVARVWQSRPTSPAFYATLIVSFLIQPCADLVIYRRLWRVNDGLPLSLFLRKRFLNLFLVDYSGEAYLLAHATRALKLSRSLVTHSVKDTNILSAGAGLVTLLALIAAGGAQSFAAVPSLSMSGSGLAFVPLLLCGVLALARRQVTTLSFGQLAITFAIQLARSVATLATECLLWWLSGALHDPSTCIAFVTLRLLVSRLPLIPNKDLIFMGLGLKAASGAGLSTPAIAAILVLLPASHYILNIAFVGLPWLKLRPRIGRSAVVAPAQPL